MEDLLGMLFARQLVDAYEAATGNRIDPEELEPG
jgi:hypothetical protein